VTSEQLQALRDRMDANRQPVERQEKYAFPRGWNECLDFVERSIKEIVGEKTT
jgi:hypothetical protein